MEIAIASLALCALAGALAAEPLAKYEHDSFDTGPATAPGVNKLTIYFLGHATLMLVWDKRVIHVDPVAEHADYQKLPKADLVLVTHEHYDHLDARAIAAIEKKDTRIVLNRAGRDQLGRGEALSNGDSIEVHGIAITAVPAYNSTPGHEQFHPRGGRDNGYVLALGGTRVYIAGDTEDIPEMADLKNIDIAFLPMNQPYTMTPAQAARAATVIKPRVLYPYHFGDTDVAELAGLLQDQAGTEVRIRKMR